MSSKLVSLKTLEINITSVFWGLKIISHFLPVRLNSVSLRLRLFRFGVCLLMNNKMMCHRQKGYPEGRDFSIMRTSKNTDYKNLS